MAQVAATFVDPGLLDSANQWNATYPFISQFVTISADAPPDPSGAPYPLIVYSRGWNTGGEMLETMAHLASQGYVVAAPQPHDTDPPRHEYVDRALDIITVLDELAAITDGDLAGMIDTDNVGLMGWDRGAEASLQMLGLQSDPNYYET